MEAVSGSLDGGLRRFRIDGPDEPVDVDVLAGQSTSQDVVGCGHHLDGHATEVGVQDARSEKERLTRLEVVLGEQGHECQRRVAGESPGQFEDQVGRPAPTSG